MEELIIDYIKRIFTVNGTTIFLGEEKMYHDDVVSILGRVFRLNDNEVDGYMICHLFENYPDFAYTFWVSDKKPKKLDVGYMYAPFIPIRLEVEPIIELIGSYENIPMNRRYYGGIDPMNFDGVDAMIYAITAELHN